jgi:hypothetical protein
MVNFDGRKAKSWRPPQARNRAAPLDAAAGMGEGEGMTTAKRIRALGICGIIIIG